MVLVLLLFSALMGLNFLSVKIVSSLNDKVDVTVYFRPDAGENEIMKIKENLQGREDIRGVEYISRAKAL